MSQLLPEHAEKFLQLHRSLILYTNKKYKTYEKVNSIDDLMNLDEDDFAKGIQPIREVMYKKDNIKSFCDENIYSLKEKDLAIVNLWKNAFELKAYIIKHLSQYTVLMDTTNSTTNQLYGIKGISNKISDIIPSNYLPYYGKFILLPFLGNIVYDCFIDGYNVYFGPNTKHSILEEYKLSKASNGIYHKYTVGDDLSIPPKTSTIEDNIKYNVKESLKHGDFPTDALKLAKSNNKRDIFEKEYSKHFLKKSKITLKNSTELPNMHYAAYRENIIAIQPSKKELINFCEKHYSNIINYLTIFKI